MQVSINAGKLNMKKDLVATRSGMPSGSRFPVFNFSFSFVLAD